MLLELLQSNQLNSKPPGVGPEGIPTGLPRPPPPSPPIASIRGLIEIRPLSCGRAPGREARALEFKSLKVPPPAARAKPAASGAGAPCARG